MRILHVAKKFPPVVGGDATAVSGLGRIQGRRGHDVHVLVYRAEGIETTDHVHPVGPTQSPEELDRLGARRLLGMRAVRAWAERNLSSLHPDIIHAHAVDVGAAIVRAGQARGIPVVLTCHGVWFPHRSRWSVAAWLERSLLQRGYDAVTAVDPESVRALHAAGLRDSILVPNGVDVSEFSGGLRRRDEIRFLSVGRQVPQKGFDVLLAATALARPHIGDPFVVELAGDGPERSALEEEAQTLGLSDSVRFLGALSRTELLAAYERATIFVLPSRYEGAPMAILEAWAAGLPVIATSVGGIPDLCKGGTALLIPPGDPAALARAMTTLAQDPGARDSLGTVGLAAVRNRFTWDSVADAYDRVYASGLQRRGGVGG